MNTKSQVPTRILFAEESFSNAIENKNVEEVANIIREACYDFHFDGFFNTPLFEELKKIDPDMPEKRMKKATEEFDKNTQELAEIIVESGFAPFSEKDIDIRPLLSVIRDQSWEIAHFYYCIGGPMDQRHRYDHCDFSELTEDEVEFFKLVRRGDTDAMCAMMAKGVNAHAKTEDRATALMVAVEYGQHDAAEKLLNWKVDIHARETIDAESEGEGVTAMNLAALNKDYQMIELLLNHGGDINERAGFDGESPFLVAVFSGDYDYMDFALQKGADVNIELYNGETGLIRAVLSENKKLATYLLENGADINHRNITGLTALEMAKDHDHTEMVDFLIEAGATNEDRMLEHLVTYRQDFFWWDNDIAFAYYHWSTEDGFSHFLIYGIGYLNKYFALSDLRRFYIRKKDDDFIETYAGDDHHWLHYVRKENGDLVDQKFCSYGRNLRAWTEIMIGPDGACRPPDAVYEFEPAQSDEWDFESRYNRLSKFLFKFVTLVKNNVDSETPSVGITYKFTRYSKKGWDFLGPHWERTSINGKEDHVKLITDFLIKYYKY